MLEQLVRKEILVFKGQLEFKDLKDLRVYKAYKEHGDHKEPKGLKAVRVYRGRRVDKALLGFKEHKDLPL